MNEYFIKYEILADVDSSFSYERIDIIVSDTAINAIKKVKENIKFLRLIDIHKL